MRRTPCRMLVGDLKRVWLTVVLSLAARWALAEAPDSTLFEQQLAAGEFSTALSAAQQATQPGQRDALLGKLAVAQARADGPQAAYHTLAQMVDDRSRYSAMQSIRPSSTPPGNAGGNQADFDSLIELITTTVRPTTWDEVGGPGTVSEFRNGVYVDPRGTLRRALREPAPRGLAQARLAAVQSTEQKDIQQDSPLRKVSLSRLEKYLQLAILAGRPISSEMEHLAGLQRIKYVFVYPETGDLVLAGPAGAWQRDAEGRPRSTSNGRPVLQLDDLVVLLRLYKAKPNATFGCSIEPTTEGLARTRSFAEASSGTPLKAHQRGAWLKKIQQQMGEQAIVVDGVDPHSRVARVLVEADYRMKLVGMGLEQGTVDVPSYLELLKVPRGHAPPPLDVLRWWFALKYDAVRAAEDRLAFEFSGQGVQVLSENELLTTLGKRVHTGKSDPTNAEFASRFTQHFAALAEKYPVYADLQNIFDLALAASLITSEDLAARVGWHALTFGDEHSYAIRQGPAPQNVQTVINHRIVNGRHVVVGVSGGVHVLPTTYTRTDAIKVDTYGAVDAQRRNSTKVELPLGAWWWD